MHGIKFIYDDDDFVCILKKKLFQLNFLPNLFRQAMIT